MLRANMSAGDLREMDLSTTMNSDPPGPIPLVDYGNLVDPDQTNAAGGNNGARTEVTEIKECTFQKTELVALIAEGLPGITLLSGELTAAGRQRVTVCVGRARSGRRAGRRMAEIAGQTPSRGGMMMPSRDVCASVCALCATSTPPTLKPTVSRALRHRGVRCHYVTCSRRAPALRSWRSAVLR